MAEKIVQFIESRFKLMLGIIFGVQIVGAVAIVFLALFVVMASGGPYVGFDPPEITAACSTLPLVFLLTLITAVGYPELKGRKWARWLLIFTVIVNVAMLIGIAWLMLFFIFLW